MPDVARDGQQRKMIVRDRIQQAFKRRRQHARRHARSIIAAWRRVGQEDLGAASQQSQGRHRADRARAGDHDSQTLEIVHVMGLAAEMAAVEAKAAPVSRS